MSSAYKTTILGFKAGEAASTMLPAIASRKRQMNLSFMMGAMLRWASQELRYLNQRCAGYRLNKRSLHATVVAKQKKIGVFFLYIGKEIPEYTFLNEKMQTALTKLETSIA